MGVHGLTTYVESHTNLLKDVRFKDSRLVIDGSSLYYRLYFNHGLDQRHGGDYDAFTTLLNQFFSALAECNIQPYVVLDGGMDPSGKKFVTLRQRLQSKIKEADKLLQGSNGSVLPILTRQAFVQLLYHRGVPVVQCPAEADWEIACLAQKWNCPVLTSDSDFYIFDLPGGYLPLHFFRWNHLCGRARNRYISARLYTAIGLCRHFGSDKRQMLPLSAVLLGNDYSTPKAADKVFSMLSERGFIRDGGSRGAMFARINGLLLWLFSFPSLEEALEDVSALIGEGCGHGRAGRNDWVTLWLRKAMNEYNIYADSCLARWFSERGCLALRGQTSLLPEILSKYAAQGDLAPWAIDALAMRKVFLIPQVENSKLPSSHACSKAIRQALYGLLPWRPAAQQVAGVQGMRAQEGLAQRGRGQGRRGQGHASPAQQGGREGGRVCVAVVEEYERLDLNFKVSQVEVLPTSNHIDLEALLEGPERARLCVLLEILGATESALASVPLHLQLAVAVTAFWLRNASPRPSQLQLQALVLNMVYGELCLNTQSAATPHQHCEVNMAGEQKLRAVLDRHRVRPGERRGLDVVGLHSFSQWQACLWSALCLNQLLLHPLQEPHLARVFSGTLVHGLLGYLKGGRAAETLLAGQSSPGHIYATLMDSVWRCSLDGNPSSSASSRGRRGRGGGGGRRRGGSRGRGGGRGRGAQHPDRGVNDLTNRFALLCSEGYFDWY